MPLFGKRDEDRLPAKARVFHKKAMKLLGEERLEEALINFERVLEAAPSALEPRVNLGSVYYQMALRRSQSAPRGWLEEAARHYRHVLGIDPDHVEAGLGLAAALNALGEHAESLRELERLARARPRHRDVQYNLAIALLHAGRRDEAVSALRQELEQHTDHAAASELLGKLELGAGAS